MHTKGRLAIEGHSPIAFGEMIVRADLDWPITGVDHDNFVAPDDRH